MEAHNSDRSNEEPNSKRPKTDTGDSTSSKPEPIDPFLSLPSDIVAKIVAYTPVAQWPSLEWLDTNFRAATLLAWRQLRHVNLERDFLIKSETEADGSSIDTYVNLILQKLVEHSPFLSSLSAITRAQSLNRIMKLNSDMAGLLAQFEHLQSVHLGDANVVEHKRRGEIPLENVVDFLESTRSRTILKELHLFNVVHDEGDWATILDRFASSFVNGREIQSPLKLEMFSFSSCNDSLNIRLDTLDTTRLTDIRVGSAPIEPQELTNLIERASNLLRIELSFLRCLTSGCNGPRLPAFKKLMNALASHEKLTTIKFGEPFGYDDVNCMNFGSEFIEMLKTVGRRGQLRKLGMHYNFFPSSSIEMDDVCSSICEYIPCIQSIQISGISQECIVNIFGLMELEEIHLMSRSILVTENNIKKIAQLPRLKRLAVRSFCEEDDYDPPTFCKHLADAPALMDLRIANASTLSADIFIKWADGFGSNLRVLMLLGIDCHSVGGLVRLLETAVRLRVIILEGCITDDSLMAIAKSCPELEILGVRSHEYIYVHDLQEIVDYCPKLKRLGGFDDDIRKELHFPKYRKIADVNMEFQDYDFDDPEYE